MSASHKTPAPNPVSAKTGLPVGQKPKPDAVRADPEPAATPAAKKKA